MSVSVVFLSFSGLVIVLFDAVVVRFSGCFLASVSSSCCILQDEVVEWNKKDQQVAL